MSVSYSNKALQMSLRENRNAVVQTIGFQYWANLIITYVLRNYFFPISGRFLLSS